MATIVDKDMRNAVEFLPGRLYYVALTASPPNTDPKRHFFCIDNELVYWNFYLDFGPLNLGQLYRFCQMLNKKLNDERHKGKVIYYFSSTHAHKRTNAAFLISAWAMLYLGRTPEEAFAPFRGFSAPFPPWHDATPSVCTFNLTILDTLRGLNKAKECKFFNFSTFNVEEYEHFEQVENGDLNWLQEGKWVAFAGPHAKRECGPGGYYTLRPEDYVPYFKKKNVTLVVRLNKAYYDAKKFTNSGIDHLDLYFVDGSNPTEAILNRFITACEETSGAIAVHCKAGLGRTGTCIGCYIMKHYKFTAEEIIGWLRIARPGSIIGPQHQYMKEQQQRMWREGELHRARLRSLSNPDNNYSEKSEADTRMLTRSMAAMSVSDSNGHSNRHNSANGSRSTKQASSSLTSSSRISPVDAEIEGASQGDLLRLRRQQNANAVHGSTGDGSSYTTRSTALERSTLSDNGRVIASVSSFTYGSSKNGVESSKYVHTSIAAGGSSSSRNQLGSGKRNSSFGNFLSTWNK